MFRELVPQQDPAQLSMSGFRLVEQLFLHTNRSQGCIEPIVTRFPTSAAFYSSQHRVCKLPLIGMQCVWKIALATPDPAVEEKAMAVVRHFYQKSALTPAVRHQANTQHEEAIGICMRQLDAFCTDPDITRADALPETDLRVRRALTLLTGLLQLDDATQRPAPHRNLFSLPHWSPTPQTVQVAADLAQFASASQTDLKMKPRVSQPPPTGSSLRVCTARLIVRLQVHFG